MREFKPLVLIALCSLVLVASCLTTPPIAIAAGGCAGDPGRWTDGHVVPAVSATFINEVGAEINRKPAVVCGQPGPPVGQFAAWWVMLTPSTI